VQETKKGSLVEISRRNLEGELGRVFFFFYIYIYISIDLEDEEEWPWKETEAQRKQRPWGGKYPGLLEARGWYAWKRASKVVKVADVRQADRHKS
jgi:hypothetical protein